MFFAFLTFVLLLMVAVEYMDRNKPEQLPPPKKKQPMAKVSAKQDDGEQPEQEYCYLTEEINRAAQEAGVCPVCLGKCESIEYIDRGNGHEWVCIAALDVEAEQEAQASSLLREKPEEWRTLVDYAEQSLRQKINEAKHKGMDTKQ